MSAANVITLPTIVSSDSARPYDARAPRGAGMVIDVAPVGEYVSPDQASRAYRAHADQRSRDQAVPMRAPRPRGREQETTAPGFVAQRIAQEELSQGLYFENFKPALAAYAAADSNFATVRRPPLSNFVVWA